MVNKYLPYLAMAPFTIIVGSLLLFSLYHLFVAAYRDCSVREMILHLFLFLLLIASIFLFAWGASHGALGG
jgi:hypothetical protein